MATPPVHANSRFARLVLADMGDPAQLPRLLEQLPPEGQPSAEIDRIRALADLLPPRRLAALAIESAQAGESAGGALLLALLASGAPDQFEQAFPQVCRTAVALRRLVLFLRNGLTQRRTVPRRVRRAAQRWFDQQSALVLLAEANLLRDVVRLCHPHPRTAEREPLFAYLAGRGPRPPASAVSGGRAALSS